MHLAGSTPAHGADASFAISDFASVSGEGERVPVDERRREIRRPVDYGLSVTTAEDTQAQAVRTKVENINSRGMFFYVAQALPLDKVLQLHIVVTPGGGWLQRMIEVKAEGRVIRSESEPNGATRFGTAVEFVRPLTLRFEENYAT